jgi:hypothetical protein
VLLTLFHDMDTTKGAFIGHLLRLDVLRRKEELFGIEKQDASLVARLDHRVRFLERHTERFLADDVLAGACGVNGDLRVESIWCGDGDQLDRRIAQHLTVVGVEGRNAMTPGERFGVPRRRRRDGDELRFVWDCLDRRGDAVGLEARADDTDLHFRHGPSG